MVTLVPDTFMFGFHVITISFHIIITFPTVFTIVSKIPAVPLSMYFPLELRGQLFIAILTLIPDASVRVLVLLDTRHAFKHFSAETTGMLLRRPVIVLLVIEQQSRGRENFKAFETLVFFDLCPVLHLFCV